MTGKVFRNPVPLIRAAIRRLGGRLATYDGTPVLHLVQHGTNGQNVNVYLSAEEAAGKAGLKYFPKDGEL